MIQSIWSVLSTVVIAGITAVVTVWITQVIIAHWEGRKKIEQTKLSIYMSGMPFLAECYVRAVYPDEQPQDAKEFLRKKTEILGTIMILGSVDVMDAFQHFSILAEQGFAKHSSFDANAFHDSFGQLNYCLCCEIHGETPGRRKKDTVDPRGPKGK